MLNVKIQLVDGGRMPKQATEGSAGMDLYAHIKNEDLLYSLSAKGLDMNDYTICLEYNGAYTKDYLIIGPGETKLISAGFKVEIPKGYEMQIRPRSGNSLKTKLRVANSPGTIDSDYRNVVGVIVENTGDYPIIIFDGDRIAQAVIQSVPEICLEKADSLSETARGLNGFGSSGIK